MCRGGQEVRRKTCNHQCLTNDTGSSDQQQRQERCAYTPNHHAHSAMDCKYVLLRLQAVLTQPQGKLNALKQRAQFMPSSPLADVTLHVCDISGDAALEQRYGMLVPVLTWCGGAACGHRHCSLATQVHGRRCRGGAGAPITAHGCRAARKTPGQAHCSRRCMIHNPDMLYYTQ